jgi:phenylacetate-CoA ligase
MLLLRDEAKRADTIRLMESHLRGIQVAQTGSGNLQELQVRKLIKTLKIAACSELFADSLGTWRTRDVLAMTATMSPGEVLTAMLPRLPILGRDELRERSRAAFTRAPTDFLHYYESSGTTGDPVAAPKAVDDLVVNTMNIGEMWGRFLSRDDSALILINGPFAPAGYQFEKVLEYVGVMSVRLWTDNVTGDYTRVLRVAQELKMNTYVGTASRLLEMLHFSIHSRLSFPCFSRLLLMAEQTGKHLTRHLENLTGARAYVCSYGSSETGTIAVTCEHRRLHLQVQSYLIEVCDAAGARLVDGKPDHGELMVTTLDLPARPLVRYRTGDLIEVTGERCPCGLALPVIRPLGRQQDVMVFDGVHMRQEKFEDLLWSAGGAEQVVLNYMLVLRGPCVVCLVTTDRPVGQSWCSTTTQRLARAFRGKHFALRVVDSLPPLANMGAYVGWKLSRVLDLDDNRTWDRLPAPIHAVLRQTLEQIDSTTSGSRLATDFVMEGTDPS